jgi:hypothetical protein
VSLAQPAEHGGGTVAAGCVRQGQHTDAARASAGEAGRRSGGGVAGPRAVAWGMASEPPPQMVPPMAFSAPAPQLDSHGFRRPPPDLAVAAASAGTAGAPQLKRPPLRGGAGSDQRTPDAQPRPLWGSRTQPSLSQPQPEPQPQGQPQEQPQAKPYIEPEPETPAFMHTLRESSRWTDGDVFSRNKGRHSAPAATAPQHTLEPEPELIPKPAALLVPASLSTPAPSMIRVPQPALAYGTTPVGMPLRMARPMSSMATPMRSLSGASFASQSSASMGMASRRWEAGCRDPSVSIY